jgi:hypothetical protein
MAQTPAKADGLQPSVREIIRYTSEAAGPDFNLTTALRMVPPGHGSAPREAAEYIRHRLRPLNVVEPHINGTYSAPIKADLAVIGQKVRPEFTEGQASGWVASVMIALSDLPPDALRKAAAEAIHTPFRFMNEVEGKLRELAEARVEAARTALRRLEAMLDEIHNAENPKHPQLEQRDPEPFTPQELRAMPAHIRSMGLSKGWVTQAELDAADAERMEG